MAISDGINGLISKGSFALGATNALSSFLPESLQKALGTFINGTPQRSASARNLNDFRASLNRHGGMARNSLFFVSVPTPRILSSAGINNSLTADSLINQSQSRTSGSILTSSDLSLLCEQATLPGMSLTTSEIRRHGYGAVEKKPYSTVFTDQTFIFFGDNKGRVHRHFYSWMNGIVKSDLLPSQTSLAGYNGLSPFEVEYKENYSVDITITCFDEITQEIIICKLIQAYPIFLGDVSLSWAETDNIMRIPITFTYYNWELSRVNINAALTSPANNLSGLQKLLKVGTAIQTLASIRKPTGIADIVNATSNARLATGGLRGLF